MLRRHARRDPREALRLVRDAPQASAGFVEGSRAFTEAVAADAAGRTSEAEAACSRAEALGALSPELLGLHVRVLRTLGRRADAEVLLERLHELAPAAVTDPVPSAFRAAP
jgi:hypothetical protein